MQNVKLTYGISVVGKNPNSIYSAACINIISAKKSYSTTTKQSKKRKQLTYKYSKQ